MTVEICYTHVYTVKVKAPDKEKADQIMAERIGHEEDYGFTYSIDWTFDDRKG